MNEKNINDKDLIDALYNDAFTKEILKMFGYVDNHTQSRNNTTNTRKTARYTIKDMIREVKYSGPATIIFWKDGSKTVAVCSDEDVYDYEKGLAMCMLKWLLENGDYNEVFREFAPTEPTEVYADEECEAVLDAYAVVCELMQTKKLTDKQKDAIKLLVGLIGIN